MSLDNRPFNWLRFLVRFVFGAIFGGIAGLSLAARADSRSGAILVASAMALFVGLIAGLWGDRFWESFRDGGFWNPFRWF
jgi:sulfite exporter TauE/SafE